MEKKYYNLDDYKKKYNLSPKIITSDVESYVNFLEFNFVYNKLWVSQSQFIPSAPVGIYPNNYPIIFKPIINLYGFSKGFKIIHNEEEYDNNITNGIFWQPYFKGKHICCDLVLDNSKIIFSSFLRSYPGSKGSFKLHQTVTYTLPNKILAWINKYLGGYRGCINIEIIDNNIIECHLRLNGDFHLYNSDFTKQLSDFLEYKTNTILYDIPYIYIFPVFIERNKKILFQKKQKMIQKFIKKSKFVRTVYLDDIESIIHGSLIRVIIFDSTSFYEGFKIQKIVESLLN